MSTNVPPSLVHPEREAILIIAKTMDPTLARFTQRMVVECLVPLLVSTAPDASTTNDPEEKAKSMIYRSSMDKNHKFSSKYIVMVDEKLSSLFISSSTSDQCLWPRDMIGYWNPDYCRRSTKLGGDVIKLVITLGGDGTVLYASWLFQGGPAPPILPFHFGSLGFLTNFDIRQIKPILARLLGASCSIGSPQTSSLSNWHIETRQRDVGVDPMGQSGSAPLNSTGPSSCPKSPFTASMSELSVNHRMRLCCKVFKRKLPVLEQKENIKPSQKRDSEKGHPDSDRGVTPGPETDKTSHQSDDWRHECRIKQVHNNPSLPEYSTFESSSSFDALPSFDLPTPKGSRLSGRTVSFEDPVVSTPQQPCMFLEQETYHILNDLVVDRGPSPYMSQLELFVNDTHITTSNADGLVIASPTGSTAYSLSAGGSIVHPQVPCFLITPICPHSLSFRPMLLPTSGGVELKIQVPLDSRSSAWASFDGRCRIELKVGDYISVTASPYPLPTICDIDQSTDWFKSLQRCLNWNLRTRQKGFGGGVVVSDPNAEPPKHQDRRSNSALDYVSSVIGEDALALSHLADELF